MEVAAITLQSLEGTQTPVDPADLVSYFPVLLESGDIWNDVVQQVCNIIYMLLIRNLKSIRNHKLFNKTITFLSGEVHFQIQ